MDYTIVKSRRRLVALVAAAFGLAVGIVCVSLYWPPVAKQDVQGAIGQRDVYRQAQLSDQDVGVAGTHPVTVDDVKRFVQSAEYKALASSAEFRAVSSNSTHFDVLTNQTFIAFAQDKNILDLFATGNVNQVLTSYRYSLTEQQRSYLNSPQVIHTLNDKNVQTLLTQQFVNNVYSNQLYTAVFSHAAMHEIVHNGEFNNLATNSSLFQSFVDSK